MRTRRWLVAAVVLAGAGWAAGRLARGRARVAFLAARAAAVFQVGRDRADYELALPYLERYYAAILAANEVRFDAARAARLELDWWWSTGRPPATRPRTWSAPSPWQRIAATLRLAWRSLATEL
jgi:hypothetical protein